MILLCLLLASCGLDTGKVERDPASGLQQSITIGGRPLTEQEMNSAVRICFAFRTKRNNFNTVSMGSTFDFKMNRETCDPTTSAVTTDVTSTLTQLNDNLRFDTNYTGEFHREVETDISGTLRALCSEVIKGNTPSNYREANNQVYEVSFTSLGVLDRYSVRIGYKNSSDSLQATTIKLETFDVATRTDTFGANFVGVVSEYKRYLKCNNDANLFDTLTQTFVPN